MSSIRQQFSDTFPGQEFYRVTGTFLVSRFPSIPAQLARIIAYDYNIGSIFIGSARNTGMFPMPYQLAVGSDTGWFAVAQDTNEPDGIGNLNTLYMGQSSGSSYLGIWVQR